MYGCSMYMRKLAVLHNWWSCNHKVALHQAERRITLGHALLRQTTNQEPGRTSCVMHAITNL